MIAVVVIGASLIVAVLAALIAKALGVGRKKEPPK